MADHAYPMDTVQDPLILFPVLPKGVTLPRGLRKVNLTVDGLRELTVWERHEILSYVLMASPRDEAISTRDCEHLSMPPWRRLLLRLARKDCKDPKICQFMEFTANEDVFSYETVLRRECNSHLKRVRRLTPNPAKKGMSPSNPVKVFLHGTGWRPHPTETHEKSFGHCSSFCEFTNDMSKSDLIVLFMWCNALPKPIQRPPQKVAFFGVEATVQNHLELGFYKRKEDCLDSVDIVASYSAATEVRSFYLDYGIYLYGMPEWEREMIDHNAMDRKFGHGTYREKLDLAIANKRPASEGLAAWWRSQCSSQVKHRHYYRSQYGDLLERFITIHTYGPPGSKCGKNFFVEDAIPGEADWYPPPGRRVARKYNLSVSYKFVLAFENSIRDGYVTEKMWNGLMSPYSVTVFFGDFGIHRFFREEVFNKYKLFVNAAFFPNPKELADYLLYLDRNETAYREYFQWRLDGVELFPHNPGEVRMNFPSYNAVLNEEGENISPMCRLCELYSSGSTNPRTSLKELDAPGR